MSLFSFFKRKKEEQQSGEDVDVDDMPQEQIKLLKEATKKKVASELYEDRINYIQDNCEQVIESTKRLDEAKVEYQAVTSYINDIQKIELIPQEQKLKLEDSARKINTLTGERAKYRSNEVKINDGQFEIIERYHESIPDEVGRIKNEEKFQNAIENDMKHLEKEKGTLQSQRQEIYEKQKFLKVLATGMSIVVLMLFTLFAMLMVNLEANMTIPFILTVMMAAGSAFFIFYEAGRNRKDIVLVDKKLNKAIGLLNKVKIKYVNTTNSLDYSYNKYAVKSAMELEYLWNQYLKAKEEEKKYKKNTEMLHLYNETLIEELQKYMIADTEVWIHQPGALVDKKEMIEVQERLNTRREKLKKQMDYNTKLRNNGIQAIQKIIQQRPEMKVEVVNILNTYDINI